MARISLSRFVAITLCAALISSFGGCTVGPEYKSPEVSAPEKFHNAELATPTTQPMHIDQWWRKFEDPLMTDMVIRATYLNLDLREAEGRLREARAIRGVAFSSLLPTLDFATSYAHQRRSENSTPPGQRQRSRGFRAGSFTIVPPFPTPGTPPTISPPSITYTPAGRQGSATGQSQQVWEQNLYQFGFDASWEIDVFGGNRRGVEAADADIDAAWENRNAVLVTVHAEVARNYVQARAAQHRLRIALSNIESQKTSLELAKSRFDAGLTGELDVAQASAQLATTQSRVPQLESAFTQAVTALAVLVGEYPEDIYLDLTEVTPIPMAPPEVPVGVPSDLLRRRPDIRRAERELAAQTARVGVAVAELYPKFSLTGNFSMQSYRLENLWDWRSRAFSAGPAIRWPIFEGGRLRSQIAAEDARLEQSYARWQKAVLQAVAEVEGNLVAFRKEQEHYRWLGDAVASNRRSLELSDSLYTQGLASFLNVVEAQRSLYLSEDQMVESEQSVILALISLYKSLGGGIDESQSEATNDVTSAQQ